MAHQHKRPFSGTGGENMLKATIMEHRQGVASWATPEGCSDAANQLELGNSRAGCHDNRLLLY